uniref:CHK domain-containing protein n=1 Tax=Anopheles epiroticus TaxID=199890 RepID=A0A182P7B0_9DIPT
MAFNKDEMTAPSWMNRGFFEKVLRHSERNGALAVEEFRILPGTKPGDHFASVIFRAIVRHSASDQEVSLIVKTLPAEEGLKMDILKDGYVFETETLMYTVIVPAMQRLLQSVGDHTVLGARLLYHEKLPIWVMVFEDITKHGYGMKVKQLDLEESKVVFGKVARWHAASMYLVDTMPEMKSLTKGVYNLFEQNHQFLQMWQNSIGILSQIVKDMPGLEQYSERIANVKETIFKRASAIYTYDPTSYVHVLNHGDCHFKNMMFKRTEEGKLEDIMLLDFQLSVWGTPAIDLIYAMYNSVSIDTREAHRDELISFYHEELTASLTKFGYLRKLPTLLEIHLELLKCGHLGTHRSKEGGESSSLLRMANVFTCLLSTEFLLASTFVPFMCVDVSEVMDIPENADGFEVDFGDVEKMMEGFRRCFLTPVYVDFIKKNLPKFARKGLIDLE